MQVARRFWRGAREVGEVVASPNGWHEMGLGREGLLLRLASAELHRFV